MEFAEIPRPHDVPGLPEAETADIAALAHLTNDELLDAQLRYFDATGEKEQHKLQNIQAEIVFRTEQGMLDHPQ